MDSKEDAVLARSRDKLKRDIEGSVLKSADDILNLAEVAIGNQERYKAYRSKVLRSANDAVRQIKKTIDMNYQVLFVPTNEDIIEVQRPSVVTNRKA
jgi:SpoU rRNA methylase family enzyme